MALKLREVGKRLGPANEPRVRALIIGGPGAGKTRWASYFPKPVYADCEDGTGSIWDRPGIIVGEVNGWQDMLDLLEDLRKECQKPMEQRRFHTVVVDTADAFQRKLKDEWVRQNRAQAFTGWEAWGWLGGKMQTLMTRLLNLDMNVIVNVHYKDKTTETDGTSNHTYQLQLSGEIGDTIFNDFDLVGWMGVYFEAEGGERVQKRGLTFKPTPDKPFLKDRLNITPKWLEVTFDESDYSNLFSLLKEKLDSVQESREVEELPTANPDANLSQVVGPAEVKTTGRVQAPVASTTPTDAPLESLDKPTLQKMARDLGVVAKQNWVKGELIAAIRDAKKKGPASPAASEVNPSAATETPAPATPAEPTRPATTIRGTEQVNPNTGEISADVAPRDDAAPQEATPTHDEAVNTVVTQLGGKVHTDRGPQAPQPRAELPSLGECDDCHREIPRAEVDYVKLGRVRYQPPKPNAVKNGLCKACYNARKSAA